MLRYNGYKLNAYGNRIRFYAIEENPEYGLIHICREPFNKKEFGVSFHYGLNTSNIDWNIFLKLIAIS